MNTIYTYQFDNTGTFLCTVTNKNKTFQLKEKKAIESLQLLDTISFDKIQVFKHSIRLYKEKSEIHLSDLDLFIEKQLDQYIPKLYQKIEKSLKDYLYKNAKKKKKQNKTLSTVSKVTMGAILTAIILSNMSIKTEGEGLSEPLELETNLINQENPLELNSIENITKENNTTQKQIEKTYENDLKEVNPIATPNQGNNVYLNYEKTNDLVKKEYAFQEYEKLANWCGEKWGISPNLILMLLTQESAGKEENLMQIEWQQWAGKPISAYNFRDNQYESFLLTNNPTAEEKAKYMCITENDLKNPKTNISIGCVLLRKSAEAMNYHIMAALQCYNLGIGNMEGIFQKTFEETGQRKEEILSDQSNLSFYDYTFLPGQGDPKYLSNIFQFIDEYGDEITFRHLQNGEEVEETIYVYNKQTNL